MADRHPQDPYAPPPRHRDRSGGLVRLVIAAGLLGAAVWGYMEFADDAGPGLIAEENQTMADRRADGGYEVTPTPAPTESADTPAEDQPPA